MPKGRILAVDDQRYFRELIEGLLSEEGYETQTAGSGEEALRILEQSAFDVVLTDLVMPGMDGCDLVHRIRERDREQDIVVVTGVVDVKTAVDAMKLGANDYLLKPFDRATLVASVESLLQRRRLRMEHARLLAENIEYMGEQSLFERSMGFFTCLAVEPLAQRIVESMCMEARAQGGVLWVARDRSETLELAAARGLVSLAAEPETLDARCIPPELREGAQRSAIQPWDATGEDLAPKAAVLLLALCGEGRPLGILRLTDKLGGGDFDLVDATAAEKLGHFAEIALANAVRVNSLEWRSLEDPATGAYSAKYFHDSVQNELNKAQRFGRSFSLLKVDLRALAGSLGADGLCDAVAQLRSLLRTTDFIAAVDEGCFAVMLAEADSLGAAVLKQRAQRALANFEDGGAERAYLAAATFPVDGTQLEALMGVLDHRLEEERRSPVRRLGLEEQAFGQTLETILAQGTVERPETAEQITRFLLSEVGRRARDRGLLFLAPGASLAAPVREGLARLRKHGASTEIVMIADLEELDPNGPPVTWVSPARVPGVPPFLIHFGDGPSYALVREAGEGEEGVRLYHTSNRSLVEYLAFRLQSELAPTGAEDEDTQRIEIERAETGASA
jgi:two-component system cell cycle response regulator